MEVFWKNKKKPQNPSILFSSKITVAPRAEHLKSLIASSVE